MLKLTMRKNSATVEQNFESSILLMKRLKFLQSQGFEVMGIEKVSHVYFPNPGVH